MSQCHTLRERVIRALNAAIARLPVFARKLVEPSNLKMSSRLTDLCSHQIHLLRAYCMLALRNTGGDDDNNNNQQNKTIPKNKKTKNQQDQNLEMLDDLI